MVCADLEQSGITARCPQLDIAPQVAMAQAQEEIDTALARGHRVRLIGSSLGGFFASALMEQHPQAAELKAALLNPAPWPARDLQDYVGELPAWHTNEVLHFRAEYLQDLKALEVGISLPQRYLLVAAKGDELLDWKEMVARYPGAQQLVLEGSDHSISDFDRHWPVVRKFLLS
jgi:uncharacterized protein